MASNSEVPSHLWADFGPVSIDSRRMGPELISLGLIMVMLLVFRYIYKRI